MRLLRPDLDGRKVRKALAQQDFNGAYLQHGEFNLAHGAGLQPIDKLTRSDFFPDIICAAHTGHKADGITAGCVHGTSGRRNAGIVPWTSVPRTYSHSVNTSGSRPAGCVHGTSGRRNAGIVPWTSVPRTYSHSVNTSGSRVLRLRRSTKSKASRRPIAGPVTGPARISAAILHGST